VASETKLLAGDGLANDGFGVSVACSADASRALVGAAMDDNAHGTNAGSAYVYARALTTWAQDVRIDAVDGTPDDQFGASAAFASDASRALVGAPLADTGAALGVGAGYVVAWRSADGDPCTSGATCASGFCVDSVCCQSACGGGAANDCQACSMALTGGADGQCLALGAGTVCRASAGVCDVAESCNGASVTCPADAPAADGTSCADTTVCNGAEMCATGVCVAGTALNCDDGNTCTTDSCDPVAGCAHVPIAGCGVDAGTDADANVDAAADAASDTSGDAAADATVEVGIDAATDTAVDSGADPAVESGPEPAREAGIDAPAPDVATDTVAMTGDVAADAPSSNLGGGCHCHVAGVHGAAIRPRSRGPLALFVLAALALRRRRRRSLAT